MAANQFVEPRRFWSKVDVGEVHECWEWLAGKSGDRGRFRIHYETWGSHRVAWILTYGPIPEGLCVCHKCDNPSCCNPYHLFLGTKKDNAIDAARKGRTRRGEQQNKSKLSVKDVLDIREMLAEGSWTQCEIADEFGVRPAQISRIKTGRDWSWLEGGSNGTNKSHS